MESAPPPPAPESLPVIPWEDRGRSVFDGLLETVKREAQRAVESYEPRGPFGAKGFAELPPA